MWVLTMEPGIRSFKALVLTFGKNSVSLAGAVEDRVFQLMNYWSNLDSGRQWVSLKGQGSPMINICSAHNTVLSSDVFEGYDYIFLIGDLDSAEVLAVREAIRKIYLEKNIFITFLMSTQGKRISNLFENECSPLCHGNKLLTRELVVEFVHDYCALNIFPNVISVDFFDYGHKMKGKTIYLDYIDFNPESLSINMNWRAMPSSKHCLSIIFIEPEHHVPDKFSMLVENLIECIYSELYITDVAYIGRNRILCLFY